MGFVDKIMDILSQDRAQENTLETSGGNGQETLEQEEISLESPILTGSEMESLGDTLPEYPNNEPTKEQLRIAELEKIIQQRDMQDTVLREFEKNNVPSALAEFVQYTDESSMKTSMKNIEKVFKESVLEEVQNRLRGKTPVGLGIHENRSQNQPSAVSDNFTSGLRGDFTNNMEEE